MITQCEQHLQVIKNFSFYQSHNLPCNLATPLPVGKWNIQVIDRAAAKLRLKDGSAAVSRVEWDCRTKGLIRDTKQHGSYQPVERSVWLEAKVLRELVLDTIFHEFAHALLHHGVDEQQYLQNSVWLEAEADVTCDLVRCMLGANPRVWTLRTLSYIGAVGDIDAFFAYAGDAMVAAACQIVRAFREAEVLPDACQTPLTQLSLPFPT